MSAGYYQKKKEKPQKRLVKGIKIFLRNTQTKIFNVFLNDVDIWRGVKEKAILLIYIFSREQYENLTEDKKQKLAEHRKNNFEKRKIRMALQIKTDWCF